MSTTPRAPLTVPTLRKLDTQDRLRALILEALNRTLHSDPLPNSVAHAVYSVRTRPGHEVSARVFAARLQVSHPTINRLEAGFSKGTPTLLLKIAKEAVVRGMTNTAEYLKVQAQLVEREIRLKGGKR